MLFGKAIRVQIYIGEENRAGNQLLYMAILDYLRANGALGAAIGSAVLSLGFKLLWPSLPFIDRVGLVFVLCMIIGILISKMEHGGEHPKAVDYKAVDTSTSTGFNLASLVIILMLAGLYTVWW